MNWPPLERERKTAECGNGKSVLLECAMKFVIPLFGVDGFFGFVFAIDSAFCAYDFRSVCFIYDLFAIVYDFFWFMYGFFG